MKNVLIPCGTRIPPHAVRTSTSGKAGTFHTRNRLYVAQGLLAAACAVFLAGCAGYSVGTTLPPDIRSAHIPTLQNNTGEPLVEITVTRAVIERMQSDGTLRVHGIEDADGILEGAVTKFDLTPLRYESEDQKAAREYRLQLTASIRFTAQRSGEVLVHRNISGSTTFLLTGDMASAKRAALPDAAQDLARNIVTAVVEYW